MLHTVSCRTVVGVVVRTKLLYTGSSCVRVVSVWLPECRLLFLSLAACMVQVGVPRGWRLGSVCVCVCVCVMRGWQLWLTLTKVSATSHVLS